MYRSAPPGVTPTVILTCVRPVFLRRINPGAKPSPQGKLLGRGGSAIATSTSIGNRAESNGDTSHDRILHLVPPSCVSITHRRPLDVYYAWFCNSLARDAYDNDDLPILYDERSGTC